MLYLFVNFQFHEHSLYVSKSKIFFEISLRHFYGHCIVNHPYMFENNVFSFGYKVLYDSSC